MEIRTVLTDEVRYLKKDLIYVNSVSKSMPPSYQVCTNKGPDCSPLSQMELGALFKEESDAFLEDNPDMCAVRFIYAPIR